MEKMDDATVYANAICSLRLQLVTIISLFFNLSIIFLMFDLQNVKHDCKNIHQVAHK